jgi:hypothetical protein
MTLTAGNDTGVDFTGTSVGDTFNAGLSAAGLQTLTGSDVLNGAGGTDTITATISASVTPNMTAIETVNISATATATLDLLASTGVVTISNSGSTAALTVSNIGSSVTGITLANTTFGGTFNFLASTVSGATDAKTFTVSNIGAGDLVVDSAVESVTINSAGTANTLTNFTNTNADTINFTGASALTITNALTGAEVINGSTATGALTFTNNNAAAAVVTTGSGADAVTLGAAVGAVIDTVSLGAGNDTLTYLGAGDLIDTDVLDGEDGTDTLAGLSADIIALTTTTAAVTNISNFETVRVTDNLGGAITLASVQAGIDTLRLDGSVGGTVTFEAGASALDLRALVGAAVTVADTGSATTDSLTITNNSAVDIFAGNNLIINGMETVTYAGSGTATASQDFGTITMTADTGGTSTLNLTGSNIVTAGAITATVINASGLTGLTGLDMSANAVGTTTITGSGGIDDLRGQAAAATTINAGAGNDLVVGGSNNDVLNGEAGNDTITANAGTDSVDGGAGNDTIIMGANMSAGDTIVGGDGTDTLTLSAAVTAASASGVSTVEVVQFSGGTIAQDMAQFTANAGFTNVVFGDAATGTLTVTNAQNAITGLQLGNGAASITGDSAVFDRINDGTVALGTANSLTITHDSGGNAATVTALTVDDEETVTITTNTATDDLTITTLNSDDMTSLTLTGAGDIIISAFGAIADMPTTVTSAGMTGTAATTVLLTNSIGAATMTGGVGVDTFTGSLLADTITGAGGADVLSGSSGGDTITGGEGADAISGGIGIDTIVLTETTAAVDTVVFGNQSTVTGGADIGFAALGGADTVTGFNAGAVDDSMTFDISAFGLAGGTEHVGTLANLQTDSTDHIMILTGAGFVSDEAAETAVSGQVATGTSDVIIGYFNVSTNTTRFIHDTDGATDGNGTTTLIATLSDFTTQVLHDTLDASNIGSIA